MQSKKDPDRGEETQARAYLFFSLLIAGSALVCSALAFRYSQASLLVSIAIGINFASMSCIGLDKSLSRSPALRMPEVLFFVLALLGGSPGMLLGMHVFRHKTRKAAFQFVLLIIIAGQVAVIRALGIDIR